MYLNYNSYTLHSSWGLPFKDKGACHKFVKEPLKGTRFKILFCGCDPISGTDSKTLTSGDIFWLDTIAPQMLLLWTF